MSFYKTKRLAHQVWRTSPEILLSRLVRKHLMRENAGTSDIRDCKCVFFLSTGRVGTQTMATLLSLDRSFVTYHEPYPLLYGLSKTLYKTKTTASNRVIAQEAFLIARKQLFEHAMHRGRGYIETSPQVTFLAPTIEKFLPNSQFVHLIRNPYDIVRSGVRRDWYAGNVADRTRISPQLGSEFDDRWRNMNPFEKNIWLWRETNEWIAEFLDGVSSERKLFLRYESCFAPGRDDLFKLFNVIGSTPPSHKSIRKIIAKKLNAQKAGSFPTADRWTSEMKYKVSDIAGSTAKRFGYEVLV